MNHNRTFTEEPLLGTRMAVNLVLKFFGASMASVLSPIFSQAISHPARAFFIGISTTEAVKLNRYLLSDSRLCPNSPLNPTWPLAALSHTLNAHY